MTSSPLRLAAQETPGLPAGLTWKEFESSVAPFSFAVFTVEPGCASPADTHAVREIWLVVSGTGELTVDGTASRVSAGDAVYLESMRTHQVRNDGDLPLLVHSMWWGEP
jgi:mannose-6-phosphate isomerase-like protein (cupin superfamily)